MIRIFLFQLAMVLSLAAHSQDDQNVFTSDIDNFWTAFDSIRTTNDSLKQLAYIRTLYINKGTEGLKAFMEARDYTAEKWVLLIRKLPRFWNSIRPNTLTIKTRAAEIEKSIKRFKTLYPQLKPAKMYFTIGGLNSGGTTSGNMVLVGAEIATGDSSIDMSEFSNNWLREVFKTQDLNNTIALNIHEYVHTQQKEGKGSLLSLALREGAADFVSEVVMGSPVPKNYISYGMAHEAELKEEFKKDMFSPGYLTWMYNGSNAKTVADLGYFMGYTICRSYYNNSKNKKKALREIIELDYADSNAVENFLRRSRYYSESLNKTELMADWESKRPRILRVEPLNTDSTVEASTREMVFVFSQPMHRDYSINYGPGGKDRFPEGDVVGWSADHTRFTVKAQLQPGRLYEFVIGSGFKSVEGYPVKPLLVRFRTR